MPDFVFTTEYLTKTLAAVPLDPAAPGLALAVCHANETTSAAIGQADPMGRKMTADTPMRIASLTKTFVAAAVLRLHETGQLDLDTSVAKLMSPEHDAMLRRGGYDTSAMNVRHLLMHASGLNDHFGNDAFTASVFADPAHVWTRTEQIAAMVASSEPVGPAGAQFRYSDTGYLVLGDIIERTTGLDLGTAVRQLTRWDAKAPSFMRWEGAPAAPGPARAHQWIDGIDTSFFNGSVDAFGGGGMIASVVQIANAYQALFSGAVFDDAKTLNVMLTAPGHPPDSPYRMGVFADSIAKLPVYRHGGFWGLDALVVPGHDLVIVAATLDHARVPQIRDMVDDLAQRVIHSRQEKRVSG